LTKDRRFPVVTVLLIAANILAAFALLINSDLADQLGFHSDHPTLQAAFTSLFLQANVVHLLGNMIFLAAVGAAVEIATGSVRFAVVYFVSGLVGVGCHFLVTRRAPDEGTLLGSSGAIAGCAAYYCVRYTGLKVPVAPKISLSVAAVTALWVVLQVAGAVVHIGDAGGTAFWSHLGGFIAGMLLAAIFRAPDLGHLKLGHEVLERMNERGPAAVATAARLHLKKHPQDVTAQRRLARACAQLDDVSGEAECLLALMELESETEHPALLGRLMELGESGKLTTHKRIVLAEKFKESNPAVAKALLKSVLAQSPSDPQRPEALLALYGLERDEDPARANVLLEELVASYPLHPCVDLARKRGWVR
jgi:membrane associated rhomboid family serine protease